MTVVVEDDIATKFNAALSLDAGVAPAAADPVSPPPPRKPDPGEVPERKPRKPRSQPKGDNEPRTDPAPPLVAESKGDYTEGLTSLGGQVWLAASALRGGKVPILNIPLPDARPYAFAFRRQLPALVAAANEGAKQSAAVRRHVIKWTGDGSKSWLLGAGIACMGLLGSCIEIAQLPADQRAQLAAANDREMQAEIEKLIEAMGLDDKEAQPA